MTDLAPTFAATALRYMSTAPPAERPATCNERHEGVGDLIASPMPLLVPLGFTAPASERTWIGPGPAMHATISAQATHFASDEQAPFRACHGCLVDGLDHNCGYTGF
jgi:hypothetical protein